MAEYDEKVKKQLEKKRRKFFRRKQREYFWLGFFEDQNKPLAIRLPLADYPEFMSKLSDNELCEFQKTFEELNFKEELMAVTNKYTWFVRCCVNMQLLDSLPDEQLEKILNYGSLSGNDIVRLFTANGQNRVRRKRILYLLNESLLSEFISWVTTEEMDGFFSWLRTQPGSIPDKIFHKIASRSDDRAIASLLEKIAFEPAQRIVDEMRKMDRDLFPICQQFSEENLWNMTRNLRMFPETEEGYSWLFANISEEDKNSFLEYLADEKISELELFDEEICAGIFSVLPDSFKEDFVEKIYAKKGWGCLLETYEALENKEEFFEILLASEDGRNILDVLLAQKQELTLLERLVKERVTH